MKSLKRQVLLHNRPTLVTMEKEGKMKEYTIRVTCEYDVVVEAETEEEALDLAVEEEYEIWQLNNFEYEVYDCEEI